NVYLSPSIAQGFALVLHELATNAAKHGALRSPTGTVTVEWSLAAGPPPALVFRWRERGGPPASAPSGEGFGTKLLRIAVASTDAPRFEYSAEGFAYELRAAL